MILEELLSKLHIFRCVALYVHFNKTALYKHYYCPRFYFQLLVATINPVSPLSCPACHITKNCFSNAVQVGSGIPRHSILVFFLYRNTRITMATLDIVKKHEIFTKSAKNRVQSVTSLGCFQYQGRDRLDVKNFLLFRDYLCYTPFTLTTGVRIEINRSALSALSVSETDKLES